MAQKLSEENLFDVRLVERHIRQGLTSRADYETHLKKLADVEDQREVIDMDDMADEHSQDDEQAS